ncbi:WecB/TagA/CpsF family glycosyltransferase [Arthrobacter globiformis]|uniref:WecB/TagA/CpsF family glycosyltransferase n=1 Tax=Arthrobacter globiformis TaxID=1665 RepID=UPI000B41AEA5|nr:WecB/TagA/CpsF family glycosyltransferase [Arthrobacter globiformis]
MDSVAFAGIPFAVAQPEEAVQHTLDLLAEKDNGCDIHLFNAYSVALTHADARYASCAEQATLNLPDGKPLALFSRLMGKKMYQVRGPAYFEDVLAAGVDRGLRHFFLGSTLETLSALKRNVEERIPGVNIVGMISPEFRQLNAHELAAQDEEIRRACPDIIWVGLGTPKQDFEARRLASAGFKAAAVGAAFDFSAGTKSLAPIWMRHVGLEWFHRLVSEPGRLWKRYLWGNSVFLLLVVREVGKTCWRKR